MDTCSFTPSLAGPGTLHLLLPLGSFLLSFSFFFLSLSFYSNRSYLSFEMSTTTTNTRPLRTLVHIEFNGPQYLSVCMFSPYALEKYFCPHCVEFKCRWREDATMDDWLGSGDKQWGEMDNSPLTHLVHTKEKEKQFADTFFPSLSSFPCLDCPACVCFYCFSFG